LRLASAADKEVDPMHSNSVLAAVVAVCGALAALYFFLAAIGAVNVTTALVATGVAVVLGAVWFAGFVLRMRGGGNVVTRAQRPDRERRGF
jgi:hypothetical protein